MAIDFFELRDRANDGDLTSAEGVALVTIVRAALKHDAHRVRCIICEKVRDVGGTWEIAHVAGCAVATLERGRIRDEGTQWQTE